MTFKKGDIPWIKGRKGIFSGEKNPFYGKHHTKESNEKNRLAHIGRRSSPQTEFQKGQMMGEHNTMYGVQLFGDLNGNWKGGITELNRIIRSSDRYKEWKNSILERDNYICQECYKCGGNLNAHHIKKFVDIITENNITTFEAAIECSELWNISNGKTLCEKCHNKTKKET